MAPKKISPLAAASRLWRSLDGIGPDTLWTLLLDVLAIFAGLTSFELLIKTYDATTMGGVYAIYGLIGPLGSLTFAGPGLALLQRRIRFRDDINQIARSFLTVSLLVGTATATFAVVFAVWQIDQLTPAESILIVLSELFANSMIFVCAMLAQAAVDYQAMIRVRLGLVLVKFATLVGLYLGGMFTIRNMALGYTVFYGAYALWLVLGYLPSIGYRVRLGRPGGIAVRSSATFAIPIAAANLQLDGDKLALNTFGFKAQNGLYGAAYRIIQLGSIPVRVVGQAAFHRFLPDEAVGKSHHLRKAARLSVFMFVLAVGAAVAIVLFGKTPLMDKFLGESFAASQRMLPWLALSIPLVAISGTPMNGLLGLDRDRERAAVFISAAVLSVALYLILIPPLGWRGAVAATLLSEAYLAIISWIAMWYYQRIADSSSSGELLGPGRELLAEATAQAEFELDVTA